MFKHPQNVCMTYFSHMFLSLKFSYLFFKGGVLSILHAFIPDICIKSTTDVNSEIYKILKSNGCRKV